VVVQWVWGRTCDHEVAGSTPDQGATPGQVVHTSVPVTKQYNLVPVTLCGREGNRRSGIALATH